MVDNVTQTGTATIATDDIGGVHYQRFKSGYGGDGEYTDVGTATPLPVRTPVTSVSGTLTATDAVVGPYPSTGGVLTGAPTAGSFLALAPTSGLGAFVIHASGTFGGGTVWFEGSPNSTNGTDGSWVSLSTRALSIPGSTFHDSTAVAGVFRGNAAGMAYVRVRLTGATTPSVTTVLRLGAELGTLGLNAPIVDRKDTGRTAVSLYAANVTAGTSGTEALVSVTISRGTAATTTGTTFAITAGKTLRITGIRFQNVAGAATANNVNWRLRLNTAGAIALTSTPILTQAVTRAPATVGAVGTYDVPIGEGLEIANPTGGTVNIGFSQTPTWTTTALTFDLHVIGYEY